MMTEISDSAAQCFCSGNNSTSVRMREESGIEQLFPGATVDDKAFEPCGYSMNAIVKVGSCFYIFELFSEYFLYVCPVHYTKVYSTAYCVGYPHMFAHCSMCTCMDN